MSTPQRTKKKENKKSRPSGPAKVYTVQWLRNGFVVIKVKFFLSTPTSKGG
jgi:hypothetical protein